jgi:Mlc titration factor MtfA (ptsG expression regulator)
MSARLSGVLEILFNTLMFNMLKRRRRDKLRRQPFPEPWTQVLERNVTYYRRLPREDREELHRHTHILLAEKNFEGCGGLGMTDEIRITVAAQAAVLLLHRETEYYPILYSVLVYPSSFWGRDAAPVSHDLAIEGEELRLGESWDQGAVVLAWDEIRNGAPRFRDGYNVVYHEFAHQLDQENADADGFPIIDDRALRGTWSQVLHREFTRLEEDIELNRRTVIDDYGAEHPAEFFAVVTECFFERPVLLKRERPELYEQFRLYYRQDPASLTGLQT